MIVSYLYGVRYIKKSFVVVNIPSLYESLGSALCYRKQISLKVVAQLFNSG